MRVDGDSRLVAGRPAATRVIIASCVVVSTCEAAVTVVMLVALTLSRAPGRVTTALVDRLLLRSFVSSVVLCDDATTNDDVTDNDNTVNISLTVDVVVVSTVVVVDVNCCRLLQPVIQQHFNTHYSTSPTISSNKLCAWRHNMPPPLSSPRGRPSASRRRAEQTQRSSSFPRRTRSHAHRCSRLTR